MGNTSLRADLLRHYEDRQRLQRKREALWAARMEIETLEAIAAQDAMALLARLEQLDLLDTLVIVSNVLAIIGYLPDDPADARDFLQFHAWGALEDWNETEPSPSAAAAVDGSCIVQLPPGQ